MAHLNIYKASAGSGKTFTLTQQFLLMLLENPALYKHVLAVTFTNKATGEMKQRILQELNILANEKISSHSSALKAHLKLDDRQIRERAKQIMQFILHDYSRFSVSTIDHFFQRIIRTFARELGLQSGYILETDESEILNFVVDQVLLATEDDAQLRRWLVDFARTRMMEEKSWNFREEILSLAEELTKEAVKTVPDDQNHNRKNLQEYLNDLKRLQEWFENTLKGYGREGVRLIEDNGLDIIHFNRTSRGVGRYFYYLQAGAEEKLAPNSFVVQVMDNPDKWPAGKLNNDTKNRVISLAREHLNPILNKAVAFYNQHHKKYHSVKEIQKNIYVLGILGDIQSRLYQYCREKNLFLISDAANFLKEIISGNDTPFVYEKTGSIYQHFMIDEFQDTSRFQWENFKPLIENSLAQNQKNLMVGDVKQSIYRWRNGDWKILEDEVEKDFSHYSLEMENLVYNRRSSENIIAYNNTIFHHARTVLQHLFNNQISVHQAHNPWQHKLLDAYADVMQKLPEKRTGGYILNCFVTHSHGQQQATGDKFKKRMVEDLERLQDCGYKLSDMAILVRKNREGQEIADFLMEYKNQRQSASGYRYDVISNDSLYIGRAESVRFILALFRYMVNPDDAINRAFIRDTYHRVILNESVTAQNHHDILRERYDELPDDLPASFWEKLGALKKTPLYEMTEKLINQFGIHQIKGEIPYIEAFQENVLEFSSRHAADLNTFLEWWDRIGKKRKLQLPEDYDAIRITTIHKAKGLEFKAVIIPFCNWEIDNMASGMQKNYLWCQPEDHELARLGRIPLDYSNKLVNTLFIKDYFHEKFHNYVDNLNLLYVALTRAQEVLISYSAIKIKNDGTINYQANEKGISDVGELMHFMLSGNKSPQSGQFQDFPFINDLKSYWDEQNMIFKMGNLKQKSQTSGHPSHTIDHDDYPVYKSLPNLRLKFEYAGYFSNKTDLFQHKIDYGKIMHLVFSRIHSEKDIEEALETVYLEGKINLSEKDDLHKRIRQLMENPDVKNWFSENWSVLTEKEILLPDGRVYRPDRIMFRDDQAVVIDYKFGVKQNPVHMKQVKEYLKQIRKMGYKQTKGYIWYVNQNWIKKVE